MPLTRLASAGAIAALTTFTALGGCSTSTSTMRSHAEVVPLHAGARSPHAPTDARSLTPPSRNAAMSTAPTSLRPITGDELKTLRASLLLTDDDITWLRTSRGVLEPHVDELLDVWYGFVGANPHLLAAFVDQATGQPDPRYLAQVRTRFGQWVLDTADAEFDDEWLARQLEFGRRHHRIGKNRTDDVNAAPHIAFRDLVALTFPVTATMEPFLARGGHAPEDVRAMHDAWRKAVLLTVILWSQPYVTPGDF